jgi:nucleotide-binding universal stress UspA family protein
LRAAGVECATAYAECNRPHEAIIDAARAHGCDLILMSSHGRRGLSELWYGSETHAVLKHSSIPTLVYR